MWRRFGNRLTTKEDGGSQRRGGSSGLPPLSSVDHSRYQSSEEELDTMCSNTSGGGHPNFAVHFTKQKDILIDEKCRRYFFAICNYCQRAYKVFPGHGYGTLKRHMTSFHTEEYDEQTKRKQLPDSIARFVATEHLSFNFGQRERFIDYINEAVNPEVESVSRSSITRSIKRQYTEIKQIMTMKFLESSNTFSICSDIWSDHWLKHAYMGVTCHWIDDEYIIQKRLLAYQMFDVPHTAKNIFIMIKHILEEYGISRKFLSISFDNASSNTASIKDLIELCVPNVSGKFFHVRCSCHVLNLCVQAGLTQVNDNLGNIRLAVEQMWKHKQIMIAWRSLCQSFNECPVSFPRDVPTRWNSTYRLFLQVFRYRCIFTHFVADELDIIVSEEDWDICFKILKNLDPFYVATNSLSGVYYPTAHLFLCQCFNIVDALSNCCLDSNANLRQAVQVIFAKWIAYYTEIPSFNLVTTVFDPRYKLKGLQILLLNYYERIMKIANAGGLDLQLEISVETTVIETKSLITQWFTEVLDAQSSRGSSSQVTRSDRLDAASQLLMRSHNRSGTSNSELESYLTTRFEFSGNYVAGDFDVLDWWMGHACYYPTLARMAKMVLAVPVSTTAVKRAFSAGGDILSARRSSLKPENLEAQTCLDDWVRAAKRNQHKTPSLAEDEDEISSPEAGSEGNYDSS